MDDHEPGYITVADICAGAGSIRAALETVGGPWPMAVLTALRPGPCRYGELKQVVEGINDRMLSQTLHRFLRDGLVATAPVASGASRQHYALTGLGEEVVAALGVFIEEVVRLAPQVAAARARFAESALALNTSADSA